MTKGKVIQIAFLLSFFLFAFYKFTFESGFNNIATTSFSNIVLIIVVLLWIGSYVFRVINGKMTFMEQRKRYRKEYEKIMDEKIKNKFESLSVAEQEKLMKDLEAKQ